MFDLGDRVCYPMFGVGTIQGIERRQVLGEWEEYYTLQFLHDRMTVFVPVKKAEEAGLRHLADVADCEQVIRQLASPAALEENTNWNKRYRENLDKLRRGDIFSTADVVQSLLSRDRERGLSAGERRMYLTARRVLITELSLSSGRDEKELLPLLEGRE